jgi:hypothetical protein
MPFALVQIFLWQIRFHQKPLTGSGEPTKPPSEVNSQKANKIAPINAAELQARLFNGFFAGFGGGERISG